MLIHVRETVGEDTEHIRRLMLQYIAFYERTPPADEKLERLIALLLDKREGVQLIAHVGDEAVGFATLYFTYSTLSAEKALIMNDLFVVEAFRSKGVAKALFDECLAYTRRHGYKYMSWVTAQDNVRAQRFYAKMGGQASDWITYEIS